MTEEKYILRRRSDLRHVPGGVEVHYMNYHITGPDIFTGLGVPCRATLHHLLTGLFYNWDWNDETEKEISREDAFILKHVFAGHKEYKLWKDVMKINKEKGVEEAKSYFLDQIKILAMRNIMREGK